MKNLKAEDLRGGQAIVEFVVGLIALLTLLTMVFQGVVLTKEHTDAMVEARAEAGTRAISALSGLSSPDYISEVDAGEDWRQYTQDDVKLGGSHMALDRDIIDRTVVNSSDWSIIESSPRSKFNELRSMVSPVDAYGLVSGEASRTVTLSEAFRMLIWDKESITIDVNVWMTHTDDIY